MTENQEQTEPTITVKEIMKQTGVRDRSSVEKRIRNRDFDKAGRGLVYFNAKARRTITVMKNGGAKRAGRPKKKEK